VVAVGQGTVFDAVDESDLPPYVEADRVDFNVKADLDTVSTLLSIATSVILIFAYVEFKDD
jgi:hypothetical protein